MSEHTDDFDDDLATDDLDDLYADEEGGVDEPYDEGASYDAIAEGEGKAQPRFRDCFDFFDNFLRNALGRRVDAEARGARWDPHWKEHPEVVLRIDALWRAFEGAVVSDDPSAMSNWWIYHVDAHLRVLLDGENGPMSLRGGVVAPLPTSTQPPSWTAETTFEFLFPRR